MSRSPRLLIPALAVVVIAIALVPWLVGGPPPSAPAEDEPAPTIQAKPDPAPGRAAEIVQPPPRPRRVESPPPAAKPPAATLAPPPPSEPAPDDGPLIDRLMEPLAAFVGESPDIDAVLGAITEILAARPPRKSGEAGMPNKVEVRLADRERRANVYVLATGDERLERYDVTIDFTRGKLPESMADRFDKLLNCRFFVEVRGEGIPTDVRGAVRFQPITDESRIGAPFVAGYSIGTFEEGQRLVPFLTEIVRESDESIGYRTSTDENRSATAPFADATRLVETVRPAFAK